MEDLLYQLLQIARQKPKSISESFKKIDNKLSSYNKSEKSQKKSTISSLKQELANIKANMGMMKAELQNLENSGLSLGIMVICIMIILMGLQLRQSCVTRHEYDVCRF